MRQIFANFCQICEKFHWQPIREIKSTREKNFFFVFQNQQNILTLRSLTIKDGHVKNISQDIKQYKQRERRKKNVNLFIISASFDLILGIQSRTKSFISK